MRLLGLFVASLSIVVLAYGCLMAIGEVLPPPMPEYAAGLGWQIYFGAVVLSYLTYFFSVRLNADQAWSNWSACFLCSVCQIVLALAFTG